LALEEERRAQVSTVFTGPRPPTFANRRRSIDLGRRRPGRSCAEFPGSRRGRRNIRDWVTIEELGIQVLLVKENSVISKSSRSSEKFLHGIKVLMAKNYIDNLSEEVKKGMLQKAEQRHWPSVAQAATPTTAVRLAELLGGALQEIGTAGPRQLARRGHYRTAVEFGG